jgi:hypothetical protein
LNFFSLLVDCALSSDADLNIFLLVGKTNNFL